MTQWVKIQFLKTLSFRYTSVNCKRYFYETIKYTQNIVEGINL